MEYGNTSSPQLEEIINKPISYYGLAKYKSTKFLLNLYKKNNFPVIILRPYQIYGPYQDENRLIPFVIKNCLKNKKFPTSRGIQFRDFLYISDFIELIYKIIKLRNKKFSGKVYNVGFGKPTKVKSLILLIKKIINKGKPEFGKIKFRREENIETFPSIKKVKSTFKWKPRINLKNGIKTTIKHFQKNL